MIVTKRQIQDEAGWVDLLCASQADGTGAFGLDLERMVKHSPLAALIAAEQYLCAGQQEQACKALQCAKRTMPRAWILLAEMHAAAPAEAAEAMFGLSVRLDVPLDGRERCFVVAELAKAGRLRQEVLALLKPEDASGVAETILADPSVPSAAKCRIAARLGLSPEGFGLTRQQLAETPELFDSCDESLFASALFQDDDIRSLLDDKTLNAPLDAYLRRYHATRRALRNVLDSIALLQRDRTRISVTEVGTSFELRWHGYQPAIYTELTAEAGNMCYQVDGGDALMTGGHSLPSVFRIALPAGCREVVKLFSVPVCGRIKLGRRLIWRGNVRHECH